MTEQEQHRELQRLQAILEQKKRIAKQYNLEVETEEKSSDNGNDDENGKQVKMEM
jgi:hypothetical protein